MFWNRVLRALKVLLRASGYIALLYDIKLAVFLLILGEIFNLIDDFLRD